MVHCGEIQGRPGGAWSSGPGVRQLLDFFPALFFVLPGGSGKEVKSGQNLEGKWGGGGAGRSREGDPWSLLELQKLRPHLRSWESESAS